MAKDAVHKDSDGAVSWGILSEHGTHPGTNTLLFFQCVKAVKDKRTVILPTERDTGHKGDLLSRGIMGEI